MDSNKDDRNDFAWKWASMCVQVGTTQKLELELVRRKNILAKVFTVSRSSALMRRNEDHWRVSSRSLKLKKSAFNVD